jgi:hypothetical protein
MNMTPNPIQSEVETPPDGNKEADATEGTGAADGGKPKSEGVAAFLNKHWSHSRAIMPDSARQADKATGKRKRR